MFRVILSFIKKWEVIGTKMIKAVFFDCDGVIVDSEPIHLKFEGEYLRQHHLEHLIEKLPKIMIGTHKSQDPWGMLLQNEKLEISIEKFKADLYNYKEEKLKEIRFSDAIFKDVKETLFLLKEKGIKIACASSSAKSYVVDILEGGGILDYFDLIVSCDDFTKSKPDPEIYNFCCDYFKLNKEECLVIEDSPMGIEAGKNAGIMVLSRKDNRFGLDQTKSDGVFDHLHEIFEMKKMWK